MQTQLVKCEQHVAPSLTHSYCPFAFLLYSVNKGRWPCKEKTKTQTNSEEIKPQGYKVESYGFGLDDGADNGKDPDRKMKEEA